MFQYCKHDNRKVDHSVRLAAVLLLGAACAPAFARPPVGNGGQGSRRFQPMPLQPADLNGDHVVNAADRDLFMDAWAAAASGAAPGQADLDQDGVITLADLNILEAAAGLPLTAPPASEPSGSSSFDWRADLNGNGVVDFPDLQMFLLAWSASTSGADPGQADINMDGLLNFTDLAILISLFGANVSPPSTGVTVLQPGDGFTGPTPQPAAIGVPGSPGYDAKAIAHWDVVPYQELDGEFNLGVVAFHRKGINRVEFSLDGGPWTQITEMTENSRTGVWEYWATLNAAELPDGPLEVRAVAFPNVGEPRVLEPLILNANAHGSFGRGEVWVSALAGNDSTGNGTREAPYKTIWGAMTSFGQDADISGLTILLQRGDYLYKGGNWPRPASDNSSWVTITAAPGVAAEDVRIIGDPVTSSNNRIRLQRIHMSGVTVDQSSNWFFSTFTTMNPLVWFDNIRFIGPSATVDSQPFRFQNWAGLYVTNCDISNYLNGCMGATIARDVRLTDIGNDSYSNCSLLINCSVERQGEAYFTMGAHADVYQFHDGTTEGHRENVIVYGLQAYDVWAQGIFADDLSSIADIAFVNVVIDRILTPDAGPTDPMFSQWMVAPTNHLLLWHVTLSNQEFRWRRGDIRNLSVKGCSFEGMRAADQVGTQPNSFFEAMGDWLANHFELGSGYHVLTPGNEVTTGDPGYMDEANNDFRPGQASPLRARLGAICRPAADGVERQQVTSVGAFER